MSTEARREDAVNAARAVEAMELWKLLPEKRTEKVPVRVSEDDFERRACDFPAMLVTKKALLNEIIRRWCDTKDEEEADRLFSFVRIFGMQRSVRWFEEEQKIFMDAIRDGTGIRFPSERAARHYLEIDRTRRNKGFFGFFDFEREFGRMLAIAFMRNSTDEQRAKAMQVALPVLDASDEAVAALAKIATNLAEFDRKIHGLLVALGWSRFNSSFAVKREFPENGAARVILTLEYRAHEFYGFYSTTTGRQFDENKAHDKFNQLSQTVEGWGRENGCGPMTLVMVVPNEYKPDEPLFRRERTFK
ncbi:MAG: hypothetical protein WC483_06340 [Candidatus Paceibacterota bacterium]